MSNIVKRDAFSVTFTGAPELTALEPHVLAVDLGTELFNEAGGTDHRTHTLIVWLEDDEANQVMGAIRTWVKKGNSQFTLALKVLKEDGAVKDLYVFEYAMLNAVQHSIFTRESQDERLEVQLGGHKYISHVGKIKQPEARELSAKLLQIAFASVDHHITDNMQ